MNMSTIQLDISRLHSAGIGVFFRPSQIDELGITYDQLRRLVSIGAVERVNRGLYRLASAEPTEHDTLAAVCARVPNAAICLLSALSYHEIGTRLPHEIWIAIPHKARPPRLPQFRTRLIRFKRRRLDLRRVRHDIRRRSGANYIACSHGRRLFPIRTPDRTRNGY